METSYHREWLQKQVEKADKLLEVYGKEGTADAEIILCCTASALASTLWRRRENDRFDRKRFVEFLVKFSNSNPSIEKISICSLARYFEQKKKDNELNIIIKNFFGSEFNYKEKTSFEYGETGNGLYASALSEIIEPEDIDVAEDKIQTIVPVLKLSEIRKSSYANIIYTDLRSGLIHEYEVSGNLSWFGRARNGDKICYMNFIEFPAENDVQNLAKKHSIKPEEARDALSRTQRRLFFPYTYIKEVVVTSAISLFEYWEATSKFEQPYPLKWWADG